MNQPSNPVANFNALLAKQYFQVVSQYSQSWDTYLSMEQRIATSSVDIVAYFKTNGSLYGLAIPGVGAKTITILEAVLSKGVDAAKDEVASAKADVFRPKSTQSTSRVPGEEEQNSLSRNRWDDAVKRQESE